MKNIFFDMDGTLYTFENGQYKGSLLEKKIEQNMINYLKFFENENYLNKFNEIKSKYGEEFSLAFNELYNIPKEIYFNKVWDVNPDGIITKDIITKEVFKELYNKNYNIYIVSESPKIWINRVLTFLGLNDYILGIYSGQGDDRKFNGKLYDKIISEVGNNGFMIGDQLKSDIIIPKQKGFKTIYIGNENNNLEFDYKITSLYDILEIINQKNV